MQGLTSVSNSQAFFNPAQFRDVSPWKAFCPRFCVQLDFGLRGSWLFISYWRRKHYEFFKCQQLNFNTRHRWCRLGFDVVKKREALYGGGIARVITIRIVSLKLYVDSSLRHSEPLGQNLSVTFLLNFLRGRNWMCSSRDHGGVMMNLMHVG